MALRGLRSALGRGGTGSTADSKSADRSAVGWGPPAGSLDMISRPSGGQAPEPRPAAPRGRDRQVAGSRHASLAPQGQSPVASEPAFRPSMPVDAAITSLHAAVPTPASAPATASGPGVPGGIVEQARAADRPVVSHPATPATGVRASMPGGVPAGAHQGSPRPAAGATPGSALAALRSDAVQPPRDTATVGTEDATRRRMILDVPIRKATMFVGAGALAGFLVGGLLVFAVVPRDAVSGSGSNTGPGASSPVAAPVSANAAAALRGTTALNGRLADEAVPLAAALAASSFPSQDAIKVFRRISVDVRSASVMVNALGDWPEAAAQQAALAAFYDRLTGQINDVLANSVNSTDAYRSATVSILATLRQIVELDATARSLAEAQGVSLPDVSLPSALR